MSCANCTKQPVQITQRYRLTMTVQDNDTSARLTLFEDVASDFIGCSVNEYIEFINKEVNETKFPIALENLIKEEHVFLFKMDQEINKKKQELSIVVEGFQRQFKDIVDTKQPGKQMTAANFHDRKRRKKTNTTKTTTVFDDLQVPTHATDGSFEIKIDQKIAAFSQRKRRVLKQKMK